jgi:hypothetical protein
MDGPEQLPGHHRPLYISIIQYFSFPLFHVSVKGYQEPLFG